MSNALIRKLEQFTRLSAKDRAALDRATSERVRHFEPRADIIREGDRPHDVNLFLTGWACRYKQLEIRRPRTGLPWGVRSHTGNRARPPDRAQNPLAASYTIADHQGRDLMTVPFTDALSPSEWRLAKARRRPHGGPRSTPTRDGLALASFRQMFGAVNAGCVLLTPEMHVVEMNEFGARHSHVDAEAIRGVPVFEILVAR